ncbi:MAG TPA: pyridoxal-phosphate dependent enzyme [Flavisolibacter sp.]|nr:pyridoxal-phosphate dependent enzyme [Flavisolibacter sp.]
MNNDLNSGQELRIDSISSLYKFRTIIDVLRLDLVDPVISGNKRFKLNKYLADAIKQHKNTLVTFGGAYSNHILAVAAAAKKLNLRSVGIIRGEKPSNFSITLNDAIEYGMQIHFTDRESYRNKKIPAEVIEKYKDAYIINEGGYGELGAEGIKNMMDTINHSSYSLIICAVGSGTTMAGIINALNPIQQCLGISVMKNNFSLEEQIKLLTIKEKQHQFTLLHHYHFGGYAKYSDELIDFMNNFFTNTGIPTDFVYTAKLFYAVNHLLNGNLLSAATKILVIHSGGLQGNRSLESGTLIFS